MKRNQEAPLDYFERVDKALEFIELHLNDEIRLSDVAAAANCSLFWFHRIFFAMTGDTMKVYIRKRRLTRAGRELAETRRRVIDIALDSGFSSQEAFTRAFKEQFLMTPGRFRKIGVWYNLRSRKDIEQMKRDCELRSGNMEPVIREMGSITVAGPQIVTKNDGTNKKEIPLFWQRFLEAKMWDKIPHKKEPWVQLGLCGDLAEGSEYFVYMIGQEVTKCDEIPPGMVARTIPPATYAVFTARGPAPESIHKVWDYVYGTWLPGSADWERAATEDFELYDERCTKDVSEVDICIPVIRKTKR